MPPPIWGGGITSCEGSRTICLAPAHTVAQLQPIHALRLACGAQRAFLPVAVGSMNIHDERDRQTDVREHHCLMP